ncbi:MAG: hypothetical protein AAFV28_12195 [Cyanobacteria bacterium J06635_13]
MRLITESIGDRLNKFKIALSRGVNAIAIEKFGLGEILPGGKNI